MCVFCHTKKSIEFNCNLFFGALGKTRDACNAHSCRVPSLSLDAEVHISVDLIAQVQDAVHVADHPREALPQLDLLSEGVVVAANPVGVVVRATTRQRERRWFDAEEIGWSGTAATHVAIFHGS